LVEYADFGALGVPGAKRVGLDLPELPGPGQQLFGRQGLSAEEEHQVFEERGLQIGKVFRGERFAQVQAAHFGAQSR